jgi:hypothetical protein
LTERFVIGMGKVLTHLAYSLMRHMIGHSRNIVHVGGFYISPQKGARYEFEGNVVRMSAAAPALSLRVASS